MKESSEGAGPNWMLAEIRVLLAVCRLRAGPQDMPFVPGIAARWIALSLIASYLVQTQLLDLADAAPRLGVALATALAVPYLLLRWRRRLSRYTQTVATAAGCSLVVLLCYTPIGWYGLQLPEATGPETVLPGHLFALLAWYGVASWSVLIDAHIYRHALDLPMTLTIALAAGLFALSFALNEWLFAASMN